MVKLEGHVMTLTTIDGEELTLTQNELTQFLCVFISFMKDTYKDEAKRKTMIFIISLIQNYLCQGAD